MHKVVHSESVKAALAAKGWDQKRLADELGVSAQAVTNWMKGVDFPRPATLLKLAHTLSLGFDELVLADDADQPVIAFRKKFGQKDYVLTVLKDVEDEVRRNRTASLQVSVVRRRGIRHRA